jgi:hypothetical protein
MSANQVVFAACLCAAVFLVGMEMGITIGKEQADGICRITCIQPGETSASPGIHRVAPSVHR